MSKETLFAFVLMPFDKRFDDIYKIGIKEPALKLDIRAERVDEQIYVEGMLERIYCQIDEADIIIADLSGQNPNVFYEVGYAHAKGKICILLTSKTEDIPFDLKHKRHIIYGESIENLRKKITEELTWAKKERENIKKSNISVNIHSVDGLLEKTRYDATADMTIKIDLQNDTNKVTPTIEASYIYTGGGWKILQEGKERPSTKAELPPFRLKYFLSMPTMKLQKKQWIQLILKAKKTLVLPFSCGEIKDSYKIQEAWLLKLVTSQGDFNYKISINVDVDEIPF